MNNEQKLYDYQVRVCWQLYHSNETHCRDEQVKQVLNDAIAEEVAAGRAMDDLKKNSANVAQVWVREIKEV